LFFQVKLLTPIKNYLNNGIIVWCRYNNRKCVFDHYCNSIIRFGYRLYYIFQQKKTKDDRYNKLEEKVFTPLYHYIVKPNELNRSDIPNILFDYSKVKESKYFKEALLHLKKINNFQKRFDELEKKVDAFNINVDKFQKEELPNLISNYFKYREYNTENNSSIENTVFIDNFLPALKSFWRNGNMNDPIYENNSSNVLQVNYLNGLTKIALVSNDRRDKILQDINELKTNKEIVDKYNQIIIEYNEIIKEAECLSNEIDEKLIK
jgi:hypothetical protein